MTPVSRGILIVHQGAIGDLVLSLPAFAAIRSVFPGQPIEVLGYPATLSLIHRRGYADSIGSLDRAGFSALYVEGSAIDDDLSAHLSQFARAFVFGGNSQEALVGNLRRIIGPQVQRVPCVPDTSHEHVIDFQLRQLGLPALSRAPRLFVLDDDCAQADRLLEPAMARAAGRPLLAIHPGSGSRRKNWPAAYFAAFVNAVHQRTGCALLMICGPADAGPAQQLRRQVAALPMMEITLEALPVLAAVLSRCRLYVGNDSGISHVAAALQVATLALFGPTDPAVWGPRGARVCVMGHPDPQRGPAWPSPHEAVAQALAMI